MLEVQDSETTVRVVSNSIDSLNQAVMRNSIISYEALFQTGSTGLIVDLDRYKKKTPVNYSFRFNTGTGSIVSTNTSTGTWELNFMTYDTQGKTIILPAKGGSQIFSIPSDIQKGWYQISSSIGNENLNSYEIQYYNTTNTERLPEKEVSLMKIIGGDGLNYPALVFRNILGQKSLMGSGTTLVPLKKATLTFEKNGKEMELILSP